MLRYLGTAPATSLLAIASLFLGACGDDDPNPPDLDAAVVDAAVTDAAPGPHRVFEHPLFAPEDCPMDPLFNCVPSVHLCADGTADMLVTDILNSGTYVDNGDTIETMWGAGDVPDTIVFTVSPDGTVLTDDWNQWEWTLNPAPEFPLCD